MPEPYSAERAAQLKARLDRDSNSRVFLQLAEEYRRAGRLDEAVRVLDDGLKTHPVYIAARVVLGRTLLESGQAERSVRELEHAVERAVLLAEGPRLEAVDFGLYPAEVRDPAGFEGMTLDDAEALLIRRALERHAGNVSHAAVALGLSRSALYRRLHRHGLSP